MNIDRFDVYEKDYINKKGKFLGSIPERRDTPRNGHKVDFKSALVYARLIFVNLASDPNSIFIIPRRGNGQGGKVS